MNFNAGLISKQIDRYGEPVTLELFSDEEYSDEGDTISSDKEVVEAMAIFNTYGLGQRFVSEGSFSDVRFSFFFKGDQDCISVNNYVNRENGERWKIGKVLNHYLNGKTVVKEAMVTNG